MMLKQSSKTSLFLIELIIAILFFSIASAICVQLFVKSHFISENTENSNQAVLWTQNLSEIFYNSNGNFDELKHFYEPYFITSSNPPAFVNTYDDYFILYFDQDWNLLSHVQNASYVIYCCSNINVTYHTIYICISETTNSSNFLETSKTLDEYISDIESTNLWHYETTILDYQQKGELIHA